MNTSSSVFVVFFALFFGALSHSAVTPLRGIVAISAGTDFSCAAARTGDVYCWGKNDVGQLGVATPAINDGGYHTALNPVKVNGLGGVVSVASGWGHSCAVRNDGSVWCWGANNVGQAGHPSFLDQLVPVRVPGLPAVASIHASGLGTCAVTVAGELWCWGDFEYFNGLLVAGKQQSDRASPGRIAGLSQVIAMGLGPNNACAVTVAGQVYCWGNSGNGQIGDNNASSYPGSPQHVLNVSDAVTVAVSYGSVCAIRAGGALACWGVVPGVYNSSSAHTAAPTAISVDVGYALSSITAVSNGYCGITSLGAAHCWGGEAPDFGAGEESRPYIFRAGPLSPALTQSAMAIAAGRNHGCALTDDSGVSCWGQSYGAGIGRFLYAGSSVPLPVLLSGKYGSIFAWIDVDDAGLVEIASGRLSLQDETVIGIGFDSNSLPQSTAPAGTVDVLDGSAVVCAGLNFKKRDRTLETPGLPGTPIYYTAKCSLPANARKLGVFQLSARYSGDSNFSASSTQTNAVELVDGPARFRRVVEFQHTGLDYYFITSRTNEIALLDGLTSQGWRRTGLTFRLYAQQINSSSYVQRLPVRRFYFDQVARNGTRGSHFYATSQTDVDMLHQLNPQNTSAPRLPVDEGVDSFASQPSNAGYTCGYYGWDLTVFRLFRFTSDDPNHRYSADPATITSMPASSWRREGVAFCALP